MRYKIITVACCILALLVFGSCIFDSEANEPEASEPPVVPEFTGAKPELTPGPKETPGVILISNEQDDGRLEGDDVEAQLPPCPFAEEEIIMLAQTMYQESQVLVWYGDKWGVSYIARQAAVGWTALNRYDAEGFPDTLAGVLSYPYAFAWSADAPVTDHFMQLARDIIYRWQLEKMGETDVGRTLPSDYYFFEGDGQENYFRQEYEHTGEIWDWSLPDPYAEGVVEWP